MANAMQQAAMTRMEAICATSMEKREAYQQHLTPPETAKLAASMFSELKLGQQFITCLDLGAGTGILSVALYDRYDGHIEQLDAVEADETLAVMYEAEMASIGVPHELFLGDALVDAPDRQYDRVILNPPYRKMTANDPRQQSLPCKSANLYSAFIAVGLSRLAPEGELVAIVPRSWMNGDYFKPFRRYALDDFSLDAIHVYGSRTEVFSDTDVLQETMLVRFSRREQSKDITVTQSIDKRGEVERRSYRSDRIIDPESLVVRIAPQDSALCETIQSVGLCPSTGKVVDFRSKDRLHTEKSDTENVFPIAYAGNFTTGEYCHPRHIGKPQWYVVDDEKSERQLTKPGAYTIVKRFSAKEERRRVVAFPLVIDESIALENHLNFIHAGTPRNVVPLRSPELAKGLALWLNSTYIDEWFRDVSGSTQVNAADIKTMPCPSLDALEGIGHRWCPKMNQDETDEICKGLL